MVDRKEYQRLTGILGSAVMDRLDNDSSLKLLLIAYLLESRPLQPKILVTEEELEESREEERRKFAEQKIRGRSFQL